MLLNLNCREIAHQQVDAEQGHASLTHSQGQSPLVRLVKVTLSCLSDLKKKYDDS